MNPIKFIIPFVIFMLTGLACAWSFGLLVDAAFPDGILVFASRDNFFPNPSDAFQTGMAIGWLFGFLSYIVLSLSFYSYSKNKTESKLTLLPGPLFAASLTCFGLMLLAITLSA